MWVDIKTAPNLIIAEMWKEYFEGEGIPTRLLVHPDSPTEGESAKYRVLIPEEKKHVAEEVLRRL